MIRPIEWLLEERNMDHPGVLRVLAWAVICFSLGGLFFWAAQFTFVKILFGLASLGVCLFIGVVIVWAAIHTIRAASRYWAGETYHPKKRDYQDPLR